MSGAGPRIALVGRPNVGKSTLFNRLIGSRKAVVSPLRGTTRDRLYGVCVWRGVPLTLIDMGGMELDRRAGLEAAVQGHVRRAIGEADALVLLCDAQEGLVPADELVLAALRRTGRPILLTVNKVDQELMVPPEFLALGVPEVFAISALHGRGIGPLLDHLAARFKAAEGSGRSEAPPSAQALAVAIVGRQNVGKSSLANALLRDERAIVSERPGTTRDAVEARFTFDGQPVLLVDTAGLRHRRKVTNPVDLFSMSRALEALARSEAALMLLDGTQGVARDDRRIIAKICEAGCGLVLVVNKWDLVRRPADRSLVEAVRRAVPFAAFAPVVAVSAKTGFQVAKALRLALDVIRRLRRGLSNEGVLAVLKEAWEAQPPPRVRGRAIRLDSAEWVRGRPPAVALRTRPIGRLTPAYHRYLCKCLHRGPRLAGIPVRVITRGAA